MLKRAQVYFRNPCPGAEETKNFLEEHGVLVIERDLSQKPFTRRELGAILGYHNPKYYLDSDSSAYKKKKLDNMRNAIRAIDGRLTPHRQLSLDECIEYLSNDELLEVTPENLRLRKRILDKNIREREAKRARQILA